MNTSEKIRYLRIKKGLSQEALGEMVGLQKAAINKYEKGRVVNIKKSMLQKLANALDVSPADLLDDVPSQVEQHLQAVQILFGNESPEEKKIRELLGKLTEDEKQELLNYLEYIISKRK